MAKTVQELREEFPELVAQLETDIRNTISSENESAIATAVSEERNRIKEIDEIGSLFDTELVNSAKYGEKPCSAQELALLAAKQAKQNGQNFMTNLESDAGASGANDVESAPGQIEGEPEGEPTDKQRETEAKAEVHELLGNKKEEN